MSPSGNFDIIGQLHWMEEPRKVYCAPTKVKRLVRAGMFADTRNLTKISTMSHMTFNSLRISTNPSTIVDSTEDEAEVNWEINNLQQKSINICCSYVDAVKINSYLQCINIDCKRKVMPQGNETKVTWMNKSCRRKRLVRRCS